MFCQHCGSSLDEGARFCKSCGNAVLGSVIAQLVATPDPALAFQHHIRVLGIVWLIYSIFHIVMSVWILAFSHYFLPVMQDLMSRGDTPFPFPIIHFLHVVYAISAAYGTATGILGVFAGAMLLQRKPAARAIAIVAAFLSVLGFPFGTAVAVYTLIVLMPKEAARNYQQLALTP